MPVCTTAPGLEMKPSRIRKCQCVHFPDKETDLEREMMCAESQRLVRPRNLNPDSGFLTWCSCFFVINSSVSRKI